MSLLGGGIDVVDTGGLGMRSIKPAFTPKKGEAIAYVITGIFTAVMATLMALPYIS